MSNIHPTAPRQKLCFNAQWRFIKEDIQGAEAVDCDDTNWECVGAPHTYNETDTFDDWSPASHGGEMNQWGGITWYRKHFTTATDWLDKKVYIEFEAVRQVAEVWLNGQYLGKSENGFLPFGFDLSPYLNVNGDNVIAVKCDNSFATDNTDGVPITHPNEGNAKFPWNNPHWHPAHGGIYRNVYLHITGKTHISLPLYSSFNTTGVYVYSQNISANQAEVTIETQLVNHEASSAAISLSGTIFDQEGETVANWTQATTLSSGETTTLIHTQTIQTPHLWEPDYPYLYTTQIVLNKDDCATDGTHVPFGIRHFKHNRVTGFFINDRYMKLRGWGQKSTNEWAGLGNAIPDWMQHYTSELMRDAGANMIRWGHTAGSPAQITAADQLGLLTIQPGVDGELDATGRDWEVRAEAYRDTVVYYRNNPSIFVWEGGNQSVTEEHVKQLRNYTDQFDPHGGRAYAHRRANTTIQPWLDLSISTEGTGFLAELPTIEGEYNREEAPRRVWDRHTPPYENYHATGAYDLTAEEFAINQATQFKKIAPRSHGGGANWIFSDSTSGGRVSSEVTRTSGVVDAVRLPKQAYFTSKVVYSDSPQLHIVGHWNYPDTTVKDIWIASNQSEVELFCNEVSLGRTSAHAKSPFLFLFEQVRFIPGSLHAVAYDSNGRPIKEHTVETTGPAVALKLTPMLGPGGLIANGTDVALFDVEAVDDRGRRVPTYNACVHFSLNGPAKWRGGYNSGKINSTNHLSLDLESGINRVAIRSVASAGNIGLSATTDSIQAATVTILAQPDPLANAEGSYTSRLPKIPAQSTLQPQSPPSEQDRIDADVDDSFTSTQNYQFFKQPSYSGPGLTPVIQDAPTTGINAYSDYPALIEQLPDFLTKGEMVAFPKADARYSAVDLYQVDIIKDAVLHLAYDSNLKAPDWITNEWSLTSEIVRIEGVVYNLYQTQRATNSTLLLSSNQEGELVEGARMFVLFATSL